jgi:hypothetical protein
MNTFTNIRARKPVLRICDVVKTVNKEATGAVLLLTSKHTKTLRINHTSTVKEPTVNAAPFILNG